MNHEVHLFLGTACIGPRHKSEYPRGERHAILFLLREEEGSEYNLSKAEKLVRSQGLNKIEFTKAGKADPMTISDRYTPWYKSALESGSALVVYDEPEP